MAAGERSERWAWYGVLLSRGSLWCSPCWTRESGCSDVLGMCVMKYSWKQRRWRAGGYGEACAHATHAMAGPRAGRGRGRGRGRGSEGFHMLSLAARAEAWCCGAGSHYAVAVVGLQRIPVEKPMSCRRSRLVPESPAGPGACAVTTGLPVAATTLPPHWHGTNSAPSQLHQHHVPIVQHIASCGHGGSHARGRPGCPCPLASREQLIPWAPGESRDCCKVR
jgi:hypothetical protein